MDDDGARRWRPRWWVAVKSISTFVAGLVLGFTEGLSDEPDQGTFGFSLLLMAFGAGYGYFGARAGA